MRWISWILINGGFAILVTVATVYGSDHAAGWVFWLSVILTLTSSLSLWKRVPSTLALNPNWPTSPYWFDFLYDVVIITMLATYGMWFTASIYSVHTLFLSILAQRVSEIRKTLVVARPEKEE